MDTFNEAINLYIEANGGTVDRNNTDLSYKSSGETIFEWHIVGISQPTEQDLSAYQTKVNKGHGDSLVAYKKKKIKDNQKEAGKRIAAIYNTTYGSEKLRDKQANDLGEAAYLTLKTAKGTNTTQDDNRLTALIAKRTSINAIRDAENTAANLINNAKDHDAVDLISVSWP